METAAMDDLQLGHFDHDIQFSEEEVKILQGQLDAPVSPRTMAEPPHVDLGCFGLDDKLHMPDVPIQSVETTDGKAVEAMRTPKDFDSATAQDVIEVDETNGNHQSTDSSFQSFDASAMGLKSESGDPILYSADIDDLFTLDDPPMQAIDHRLSPPDHALSTLSSSFQPNHQFIMQQQNATLNYSHADMNPSFFPQMHRNPAIAEHPIVADHLFANGRRRSQSVPVEGGPSFQRRLDRGDAISIGRPISGSPTPVMGPPMRQVQGYRHHPYQWQDNGSAMRSGGGPPRMVNGMSPHVNNSMYHPGFAQGPTLRHTHSAPLGLNGDSAIVEREGFMNAVGGGGGGSTHRRQMNQREENDRKKIKKQKSQNATSVNELDSRNHYFDMAMMHFGIIEQLLRDGFDDLKYGKPDELERARTESRKQNRQLTVLTQPLHHLPTHSKPTFDLPQTGSDVKGADSCIIDLCLEYYGVPYSSAMYPWEKKRALLDYIGCGMVLMREILE
ncbi:hypothetical protein EJ08DRAFT_130273 [Tothia fuscella]|uniref:Uncharacterized protein n=1 Tax=Tothia fuscella TaxID=1048955 RepID=A0A9P4NW08_9PEZI|nr:hypothetical protein EJ08DRAFT_130273 [Tothia fuscella]